MPVSPRFCRTTLSAANNNAVTGPPAPWRRGALLAALALGLASCAAETAQRSPIGGFFQDLWRNSLGADPPLPRPPPPPPARPRPRAQAAAPPPASADVGAAGSYRVVADGTVGCTDPAAPALLDRLRSGEEAPPRALVQAHREGGCKTVFRVSRWQMEEDGAEVVRLRLQDPPGGRPVVLNFLRRDVEARP